VLGAPGRVSVIRERAWAPPFARALVLGLARSGEAAALLLRREGVEVVGVDRSPSLDAGRLAAAGVEVRLGNEEVSLLDGVELLVKSPGVRGDAPLVAAARTRGIPVWSEVELGARLLDRPIVGVTGTNGKTTTTELLGAMFRAAGRPVEVAGNVGRALTSVALESELDPEAWIVCELSSFQLEDIESLRPRVAVLLNLEPDHLDRHGSLEAYREAKLRIFEKQGSADVAVVPRGFGPVPGAAARVEFDANDPLPAEPRIPGAHNRENAAAATAAARAAGLPDEAIADALRTFAGVPHRLELVAELGGVRYVNDSKATNTAAARRGIAAYAGEPLHLILGGSRKGEEFTALAAELPETVRTIHLIGESAGDLAPALDAAGRAYSRDETLERAVASAHAAAEPGDVVLLSPACASFDQFANFEARGDEFRRLVGALA
jgi:UDP-N-acetylmuramoylalanine--D-glutamate ligase